MIEHPIPRIQSLNLLKHNGASDDIPLEPSMQDPLRALPLPDGSDEARRPAGIDRRRLLRGGAASAPVILGLASQPVSATGLVGCTKASGFVSMNTFASQQNIKTADNRYAQCTSNGLTFWNGQAIGWNGNKSGHIYRAQLAKRIDTFFGVSCTSGSTLVGDCLRGSIQNSGNTGVLQRLLAMGCSVAYNMVGNSGNIDAAYLGSVWVNFNTNGGSYRTGVGSESMNASQLIVWLNVLTSATPIVNTAP